MIGGINLHAIVRPVINALHPEVKATLYQSTGQTTSASGNAKSIYAPGVAIIAQKQSESPVTLFHAGQTDQTEDSRKFYLFSNDDPAQKVQGEYRPLSRGGDMFQLEEESWWLVTALIEDFTRSGWASVRATLQVNPPDFSNSGWYTP